MRLEIRGKEAGREGGADFVDAQELDEATVSLRRGSTRINRRTSTNEMKSFCASAFIRCTSSAVTAGPDR